MSASADPSEPSDLVDLEDLTPLERDRAREVRAHVRLAEIRDPAGPAFHAAYDLLASFFLANGELEPKGALADFVRRRSLDYGSGIDGTYHLIGAWHGEALVGVRDCYVDLDRANGMCLVALAHVIVAPAWRRTGLASMLRAVPVTLARRTLAEQVGRPMRTLVVAEMEPADPADPDTVVRLLAYGRSGFRVIDPVRLPYSQPEFRELPDAAHTGLPLLGVVRTLGVEGDLLPLDLAELFPRLFYLSHRIFLPAARVDASERHVLAALRSSDAPLALLPLPTSRGTLDRLAPLVRGAVLPLYPPALRGPHPTFGDPTTELAEIRRAWGDPG